MAEETFAQEERIRKGIVIGRKLMDELTPYILKREERDQPC